MNAITSTANTFLSCDWGTSSFRIRWVGADDLAVRAAEQSDRGIAGTYRAWQQTGQSSPAQRLRFYQAVIREHIQAMEQRLQVSLAQAPVIVSGMASSSIGMMELPYQPLPFAIDGTAVTTRQLPPQADFEHPLLLISGVCSDTDVMRGEETQLIGCLAGAPDTGSKTVIFPGTHSKHIEVKGRQAVDFKTYMTGEFFELLRKHSILHDAVQEAERLPEAALGAAFSRGVAAAHGSLLHTAFHVRTNRLFNKFSKEENLEYLSGLLIGTELQALRNDMPGAVYLFGGAHLQARYAAALEVLGLRSGVTVFPAQQVDEATVKGQYLIFQQTKSTHVV